MEIRKYQAKSISEAIKRVKSGLGPEAMIISTKKVGQGEKYSGYEIEAVPHNGDVGNIKSSVFNEVKEGLMSIKEMIYLTNQSGVLSEKLMINPGGLRVYAGLVRNGVNQLYAKRILEMSGALKECPGGEIENIRQKVEKEMRKILKVKEPFEAMDNRQVIAAFVGTTGVGKTTTIAKLAAQLMLKQGKKVGLMSIDNYRIGAVEQLMTYGNILGVACCPAFSKKDVLFGLRRMQGKDVVLIDTAGQSQYDMARMEELKAMVTHGADITCHLLLSVATTESEMHKTAVNFGPLNIQSYIFTKTDEAKSCGSVINQIMKQNLPISYLTTGQNVPDDITRASKEMILKMVFNGN